MALIVQKFGGTSVGSVERITQVAEKIRKFRAEGHGLVVVVAAMSGEANRLIAPAKGATEDPDHGQLDGIRATGEQATIGLLAMALKAIGVPGVSFTGPQVRIGTDNAFGKARIQDIEDGKLRD